MAAPSIDVVARFIADTSSYLRGTSSVVREQRRVTDSLRAASRETERAAGAVERTDRANVKASKSVREHADEQRKAKEAIDRSRQATDENAKSVDQMIRLMERQLEAMKRLDDAHDRAEKRASRSKARKGDERGFVERQVGRAKTTAKVAATTGVAAGAVAAALRYTTLAPKDGDSGVMSRIKLDRGQRNADLAKAKGMVLHQETVAKVLANLKPAAMKANAALALGVLARGSNTRGFAGGLASALAGAVPATLAMGRTTRVASQYAEQLVHGIGAAFAEQAKDVRIPESLAKVVNNPILKMVGGLAANHVVNEFRDTLQKGLRSGLKAAIESGVVQMGVNAGTSALLGRADSNRAARNRVSTEYSTSHLMPRSTSTIRFGESPKRTMAEQAIRAAAVPVGLLSGKRYGKVGDVAHAGASKVGNMIMSHSKLAQSLGLVDQKASAAGASLQAMIRPAQFIGAQLLYEGLRQLSGFVSGEFRRVLVDAGGQIEMLDITLTQLGKSSGYTPGVLRAEVENLKKSGIETKEAQQAVANALKSGMDPMQMEKLADVARNAAILSQHGASSSDALQGLMHGIVSAQTDVIRTQGLNVSFEDSYAKMAAKLKVPVSALTEAQRIQARFNAVLLAGVAVSGAYEAAMESAGKQLKSTRRYVDEVRNNIGTALNPVLGASVKGMNDWWKEIGTATQEGTKFHAMLSGLSSAMAGRINQAWASSHKLIEKIDFGAMGRKASDAMRGRGGATGAAVAGYAGVTAVRSGSNLLGSILPSRLGGMVSGAVRPLTGWVGAVLGVILTNKRLRESFVDLVKAVVTSVAMILGALAPILTAVDSFFASNAESIGRVLHIIGELIKQWSGWIAVVLRFLSSAAGPALALLGALLNVFSRLVDNGFVKWAIAVVGALWLLSNTQRSVMALTFGLKALHFVIGKFGGSAIPGFSKVGDAIDGMAGKAAGAMTKMVGLTAIVAALAVGFEFAQRKLAKAKEDWDKNLTSIGSVKGLQAQVDAAVTAIDLTSASATWREKAKDAFGMVLGDAGGFKKLLNDFAESAINEASIANLKTLGQGTIDANKAAAAELAATEKKRASDIKATVSIITNLLGQEAEGWMNRANLTAAQAKKLEDAVQNIVDYSRRWGDEISSVGGALLAKEVHDFDTLDAYYRDRAAQVKAFWSNLSTLTSEGLNAAAVTELIQGGPEKFGAPLAKSIANAMAEGGTSGVARLVGTINKAQGEISDAATQGARAAGMTQVIRAGTVKIDSASQIAEALKERQGMLDELASFGEGSANTIRDVDPFLSVKQLADSTAGKGGPAALMKAGEEWKAALRSYSDALNDPTADVSDRTGALSTLQQTDEALQKVLSASGNGQYVAEQIAAVRKRAEASLSLAKNADDLASITSANNAAIASAIDASIPSASAGGASVGNAAIDGTIAAIVAGGPAVAAAMSAVSGGMRYGSADAYEARTQSPMKGYGSADAAERWIEGASRQASEAASQASGVRSQAAIDSGIADRVQAEQDSVLAAVSRYRTARAQAEKEIQEDLRRISRDAGKEAVEREYQHGRDLVKAARSHNDALVEAEYQRQKDLAHLRRDAYDSIKHPAIDRVGQALDLGGARTTGLTGAQGATTATVRDAARSIREVSPNATDIERATAMAEAFAGVRNALKDEAKAAVEAGAIGRDLGSIQSYVARRFAETVPVITSLIGGTDALARANMSLDDVLQQVNTDLDASINLRISIREASIGEREATEALNQAVLDQRALLTGTFLTDKDKNEIYDDTVKSLNGYVRAVEEKAQAEAKAGRIGKDAASIEGYIVNKLKEAAGKYPELASVIDEYVGSLADTKSTQQQSVKSAQQQVTGLKGVIDSIPDEINKVIALELIPQEHDLLVGYQDNVDNLMHSYDLQLRDLERSLTDAATEAAHQMARAVANAWDTMYENLRRAFRDDIPNLLDEVAKADAAAQQVKDAQAKTAANSTSKAYQDAGIDEFAYLAGGNSGGGPSTSAAYGGSTPTFDAAYEAARAAREFAKAAESGVPKPGAYVRVTKSVESLTKSLMNEAEEAVKAGRIADTYAAKQAYVATRLDLLADSYPELRSAARDYSREIGMIPTAKATELSVSVAPNVAEVIGAYSSSFGADRTVTTTLRAAMDPNAVPVVQAYQGGINGATGVKTTVLNADPFSRGATEIIGSYSATVGAATGQKTTYVNAVLDATAKMWVAAKLGDNTWVKTDSAGNVQVTLPGGTILRDSGGPLPPGYTNVQNSTGQTEWVLNPADMRKLMRSTGASSVPAAIRTLDEVGGQASLVTALTSGQTRPGEFLDDPVAAPRRGSVEMDALIAALAGRSDGSTTVNLSLSSPASPKEWFDEGMWRALANR